MHVLAVAFLVSLAISGTSAVYAVGECVVKAVGNSTSTIAGTIRFTQVRRHLQLSLFLVHLLSC
jgi:hypothetical protein